MSKLKQIEEMALDIMQEGSLSVELSGSIALSLYNAGYRKRCEWISVDDDLPNVNKTLSRSESVGVIACIEGRDTKYVSYRIFERVSRRKKTVYRWKYPWDTLSDEKITHWMPLPEAPRVKGATNEKT